MDIVRAVRQAVESRGMSVGGGTMSIDSLDRLMSMLGGDGQESYSGKMVSPRSAIGIAAVWSCVVVLADDFATLPLPVYNWIVPGVSRDEARSHYLWPLLNDEANPRLSAHDFKKLMETWRQLWGNAYAEMDINGRGQVTALWPWRPDRVKVWKQDPDDPRSEIFYSYMPLSAGAPPITRSQDQMLHVKGLSLDGIVGISPIEAHRQTLGLSMAMTEQSARFYGRGALLKGIFTHPGKIGIKGEQDKIEWLKQFQGVANSWKTMILEEGMKYEDVGIPQRDAQYIESSNFTGEDICRIYKVPQHRAGFMTSSTNNNIEHQGLEYVQYTLGPNAATWVSQIHCFLLSVRERNDVFAEPDFSYILEADHQARASYYTALANTAAISPDEIRHREGYNPLPKGIGKLPRAMVNTVPLGSDVASGTRPAPPKDPEPEPEPKGKPGSKGEPEPPPAKSNGLAHF
jgi:HK97 family phage portal protein